MIVRNEAAVIARCLDSVKDLVDYWTIVDTGSTDDTVKVIRQTMRGIPGNVHKRKWVNFGHNRTQALRLAKGTAQYLLQMDADYELVRQSALPRLTADAYMVSFEGPLDWRVPQLISGSKDWYYVGSAHEYLTCDEPYTKANLDAIVYRNHGDGAGMHTRSQRNLELLLKDEMNERTVFYLAQTYKDLGDTPKAVQYYTKRIAMGGWDEEIFYSTWQKGLLSQDPAVLLDAWQLRPTRAEPLHSLAMLYNRQGKHDLAYLFATKGLKTPYPPDILFVQRSIYHYEMLFEWSIAAYWAGEVVAAHRANQELLKMELPDNIRNQVIINQKWCEKALAKSASQSKQR